jgi:putative flippase GtrA
VKFLRYALVGAVGTAAHYALLIALVQAGGVAPVPASTAGAILGAILNYVLNHRYTFASRRRHRVALPRFATLAVFGTVLNAALLAGLVNGLGMHYLIAQLLATLAVLGVTYLGNRTWTF